MIGLICRFWRPLTILFTLIATFLILTQLAHAQTPTSGGSTSSPGNDGGGSGGGSGSGSGTPTDVCATGYPTLATVAHSFNLPANSSIGGTTSFDTSMTVDFNTLSNPTSVDGDYAVLTAPCDLDATGVTDRPDFNTYFANPPLRVYQRFGDKFGGIISALVPNGNYVITLWLVGPRTYTIATNGTVSLANAQIAAGAIRQFNIPVSADSTGKFTYQITADGGHSVNLHSQNLTASTAAPCLVLFNIINVSYTVTQGDSGVAIPLSWSTGTRQHPFTEYTTYYASPYGDFSRTIGTDNLNDNNAQYAGSIGGVAYGVTHVTNPEGYGQNPSINLLLQGGAQSWQNCSPISYGPGMGFGLLRQQPSTTNVGAACNMQPGTYELTVKGDGVLLVHVKMTVLPKAGCQVQIPCPAGFICNYDGGDLTGGGGAGSGGGGTGDTSALCKCMAGSVGDGLKDVLPDLVKAIVDALKELFKSLFIPSTSTLDQLMGTNGTYENSFLKRFMTWGPVNILKETQDLVQSSASADPNHAPAFAVDVFAYEPFYQNDGGSDGFSAYQSPRQGSMKTSSLAVPGSHAVTQSRAGYLPGIGSLALSSNGTSSSVSPSSYRPNVATVQAAGQPPDTGNPAIVYRGTMFGDFSFITGNYMFTIFRYVMELGVYVGFAFWMINRLLPRLEF